MTMTLLTILAALGLLAVHLFGGKLRFLDGTPRSIWLSAAGGISVAYVFIHLLPELAEGQEVLKKTIGEAFKALDHHAYLIALTGLIIFYGLERAAKDSHTRDDTAPGGDTHDRKVFWLHATSFAIYNVLIGYLLVNNFSTVKPLVFFFIAMALHFLVTDYGLREDFKELYTSVGRWVLAAAVLIGCAIGLLFEVPDVATSALVALLAGGVILNVLKEELPAERHSKFTPFLIGAAVYAGLLLAF